MHDHRAERRRFTRIGFDAHTELQQGPHRWPVTLIDLSLKGLLIERPQNWQADRQQPFTAQIQLDAHTQVNMDVRLVHDGDEQLGFACEHIDLDSISHLRRLIELNMGDPAQLDRELGALITL